MKDIFNWLHQKEVFFRFENNEDGFYLSIIDRKTYPRVWADNFQDNKIEVIAESADNIAQPEFNILGGANNG